jgi:hypothetical protein
MNKKCHMKKEVSLPHPVLCGDNVDTWLAMLIPVSNNCTGRLTYSSYKTGKGMMTSCLGVHACCPYSYSTSDMCFQFATIVPGTWWLCHHTTNI